MFRYAHPCRRYRCIFSFVLILGTVLSELAPAFPAEVAVAPRNDLKLTIEAILSARKSLAINIYEMKSAAVVDAVVSQVRAGIDVQILQEGQPVGGMSKPAKALQKKIVKAMADARGSDHYFVMTSKARSKRRFRFDHAKYVVVDGESLLVGSENYSESNHPTASKPGNRGWEVFLHDRALTKRFQSTFAADTDPQYGDLLDLMDGKQSAPAGREEDGHCAPILRLPANTTVEVSQVESFFSPDSEAGLVGLLDGAKKTLEIELMTLSPIWDTGTQDSPLIAGIEAAARRGVKVRVLLNDETVFQHGGGGGRASKNNNHTTVEMLNQLASDEGLDLEAKIADLKAMGVSYIHNKGVLVDGAEVLVSSINWDRNSVEHNREAAVVLHSAAAYDFFAPVFQSDWQVSP